MGTTLGLIIGLLFPTAVGATVLSIIQGSQAKGHRLHTLSLSVPLGIGLMSLEAFFISVIGLEFSWWSLAVPWLPLFLFSLIRLYRAVETQSTPPPAPTAQEPWTTVNWVLVIAILFSLGVVYFESMDRSIYFDDGFSNWGFKAKAFYLDGQIYADFLTDESYYHYMHSDYPLNIVLAQTWLHLCNGLEKPDDRSVRILCFVFYASLLGLFYSGVRPYVTRSHALLFTVLLGTTPAVLTWTPRMIADIPLAAYIVGSATCLIRYLRDGRKWRPLILAAVMAGLSAWTKGEGLIFLLILTSAVAFDSLWGAIRGAKQLLLRPAAFLFIGLAFVEPWSVYQSLHGIQNDLTRQLASALELYQTEPIATELTRRWGAIQGYSQDAFTSGGWGMLWAALALTAMVTPAKMMRKGNWLLSYTLVCWFFFLTAFYLLTPMRPGPDVLASEMFVRQLTASLDRLIVQILPVAFMLLCLAWPSESPEAMPAER